MSIFSHVLARKPKRSTFDLSHDVKLTCDFGQLVPFLCEEVVPGDTWKDKSTVLCRFAPMRAPIMHRCFVTTHFFYVPFRLIWDEFEEFITGGEDGKFKTEFPRVEMLHETGNDSSEWKDVNKLWRPGYLADYLNYPTSDSNRTGGGMQVSALPFRAYQLIYNDYYRDENLEEDLFHDKHGKIGIGSGIIQKNSTEYIELLTLRNRAWRKDYLTSALPWTQRGPAQSVPLLGNAQFTEGKVSFKDSLSDSDYLYDSVHYRDRSGVGQKSGLEVRGDAENSRDYVSIGFQSKSEGVYNGTPVTLDNSRNLSVSGAATLADAGFLINDLRRANKIQKWLERQARGGSRYIESLLSHFGVESDDLRLQRPEFLGGSHQQVQIGDVLQTSQTTDSSPLAQPAGTGFSVGGNNGWKRTFKERGLVIGILSITPEPTYSEGLPRAYRRFDKFDYYWPEFASLGEQEILNSEVALRGEGTLNDTFGYAPRFAEYKYVPSRVHGDFKTSLDFWTLSRYYSEQPTLSKEFIKIRPIQQDLNRVFAVTGTEDNEINHMWVQIHNEITARRPMPYLPEPSL